MARDIPNSAELLFREAVIRGLSPQWEGIEGVFSIARGGGRQLFSYVRSNLNTQLGAYLATNKVATHRLLESVRAKTIPYCLPKTPEIATAFLQEHGIVICKPTSGYDSKGVERIDTEEQLLYSIKQPSVFLEKYIPGLEWRYLILKSKVVAVQRKEIRPTEDSPWNQYITNILPNAWDETSCREAVTFSELFNLGFCAIDYKVASNGERFVLEINAMPALSHFHYPEEGEPVNVTAMFMDAVKETP